MKVETKETGNSTYTLTVEVPADRVSKKIQQLFREVSQQVTISGFRRGKVPRAYLEKQFGADFLDEDVQNALIEESLPQALEQESLRPLSRPDTRVVDYEEGKPFVFEADIEVLPIIEFPVLSEVTVEVTPKPDPAEDDVDRILDDLKVQHATLLSKDDDTLAALGDVAVIQLGEEEREIVLGEGSDLSEQLVGHPAGDTVDVQLEEQSFSIEIVELKSMEKPDLEELAAVLDQPGEAELLEEITSQLQDRIDHEYLQAKRYKVLDALIAAAEVPVPPRLKEEVIKHELDVLQRSGRLGALNEDDRASYAEGAEQRLQREVALEALKRQRPELKLDDEAFETLIEAEAAERDLNPIKFRATLERDNALGRFRSQKEDEALLDYLVEQVNVVETESPTEEKKENSP